MQLKVAVSTDVSTDPSNLFLPFQHQSSFDCLIIQHKATLSISQLLRSSNQRKGIQYHSLTFFEFRSNYCHADHPSYAFQLIGVSLRAT